MDRIQKLLAKVLKKIKPSEKEIRAEMDFAEKLIGRIKRMEGNHVEVMLAGSLARNTHLKNDRDIDIFVLFPRKLGRQQFEKEGLRIGRNIFRCHAWEKTFSEHPYIRGNIDGFDVEVVPSYKISGTELLKSSVDRSPFHCDYVRKKLGEMQRDEVRLLRQFLKGMKCYGADLRFSSFPGYVVELLIICYGSFAETIEAVASWRQRELIDLEKYYPEKEALKKFDTPLVVIDPVDKNRNVAAALSLTQYSRFIAAARAFLKRPSKNFFFGRREREIGPKKLREILKKKELIAIELGYPKGIVADIMWGQLRRFRKKLVSQLLLSEFAILRSDEWIDEKESMIILIELEALLLQKTTKRTGPPVAEMESSNRFLEAHKKLVAGPRIEQGRWVIEVERKYTDVRQLLKHYLDRARKVEKQNLRKALSKRARILSEADITALYAKKADFREFISAYLKGKEEFLDY